MVEQYNHTASFNNGLTEQLIKRKSSTVANDVYNILQRKNKYLFHILTETFHLGVYIDSCLLQIADKCNPFNNNYDFLKLTLEEGSSISYPTQRNYFYDLL